MEQTALIVIDMQCGLLDREPLPRNLTSVIANLNRVGQQTRRAGGSIVHIQHHGIENDSFTPHTPGWQFLPEIEVLPEDSIVAKTTCDAFCETTLDATLREQKIKHLLIGGWATDFCVDTTIRAASSRKYAITVIADGHTAADRPHLAASKVIEHHNSTWRHLIVPHLPIRVIPATIICHELGHEEHGDGTKSGR